MKANIKITCLYWHDDVKIVYLCENARVIQYDLSKVAEDLRCLYCLSVSNKLNSILYFCNEHCRFKIELYILIQSYIYLD